MKPSTTKTNVKTGHFRVNTPEFLKEIADNALSIGNMGVLKVPLNVFQNLLAIVAQRATELNDPIMNSAMFDLSLYELPDASTKEYGELMNKVYAEADKQRQKEAKKRNKTK